VGLSSQYLTPAVWMVVCEYLSTAGYLSTLTLPPFKVGGLACTPSGHLIASAPFLNVLFVIDPVTCTTFLLAGSRMSGSTDGPAILSSFISPYGVCVVDEQKAVMVCDSVNRR
jgi:hypothetical protein